MSKHTPKPIDLKIRLEEWPYPKTEDNYDLTRIVLDGGPADRLPVGVIRREPYAQRVLDCVNHCAGTNPKAVPMMREALKNLLALIGGWMDDKSEPTREEADKFFDVCNAAVDALELAKPEGQG